MRMYRAAFGLVVLSMTVSVSASAQEDIGDFVRATYIGGIPYDDANAYTPNVVPMLLRMLADENESLHWGNVIVTLCIIGDESVVEPIIAFIERNVEGNVTESQYRAKSSAIMALGYLINKSGNERSLTYLTESVSPALWNQRGIEWRAPFHADDQERNIALSNDAILGLALSGRPEARTVLRNLQSRESLIGMQEGLISAAVETLDAIAERGLSGYYEDLRAGPRR